MSSVRPEPSGRPFRPRSNALVAPRPRSRPAWLGAATATAVVVLALASGTVDGSNASLVAMGFDPDRAQLITSLLVGAVAAAAVVLAVRRTPLATLLGLVSAGALFGGTFVTETRAALAANGPTGSFDLAGWGLTVVTLLVSGAVAAWAGAALAAAVRGPLLDAAAAVDALVRREPAAPHALRRAAAALGVVVLLAVTVPVFGDLVNLSPDARMLHGGPPRVGLAPGDASGGPGGPSASILPPTPGASGGSEVAGRSSPRPGSAANQADSGSRPWLAWLPSGPGGLSVHTFAAPWKGGRSQTLQVTVYTPPGYATSGRRYPVLYEVPTPFHTWDGGTSSTVALDSLVDAGSIPPVIVVYVDSSDGPFADTECANSYDGRQWYDTFAATTIVRWVDASFRTIATPASRAVTGLSQGGYCAAILALRHPDVFGTAIAFSGYFQAGVVGPASAAPFGDRPAALAAASPTIVAAELPAAQRSILDFILVADPSQPLYGTGTAAFARLLAADGYSHLVLAAAVPHGWQQVRLEFPAAMEAWAERLARLRAL